MHHDVNLILTVGMGLVLAFAFGFVAARLHLPPLIGYLVAGIAIGPFTPGYVGDAALAGQLAEIGVILLMFGVGLHFSLDDLKAVRSVAVPGAVGQIAVATAIGLAAATAWGWTFGAGLVFGLCLSVASTVVLLKALEERGMVAGANGRIAVGWLIVEDLAMVLALVLVPAFAGALGGGGATNTGQALLAAGLTVVKVGAFLTIMLVIGPRILPTLLRAVARLGSRELFTLAVFAAAMGIALLAAKLFDLSFALGAFCAGMVLSKSEYSHRAASDTLPLQDAFAVLFFVSVGMLFDPAVLVREPLAVAVTVAIVVVGKALIALAIVLALGYPARTAAIVAASLAQLGEFSFILAALGVSLNLLPPAGRDLVLAGAIFSILLNPLAFAAVGPVSGWLTTLSTSLAGRARRQMRLARLERALAEEEAEEASKAPQRLSLSSEEVAGRFPIFGRLEPASRDELAALFTPRQAAPGERVIRRGDVASEIFFISAGAVAVALRDRTVELGPGEFFGEIGVLSGSARSADVTSLDFTELLALSRSDLFAFLERHPELTVAIGDIAETRTRQNRAAAASPA